MFFEIFNYTINHSGLCKAVPRVLENILMKVV